MLAVKPARSDELTAALALMKLNMEAQLAKCGLSWDEEWHHRNYIGKDNYSIFDSDDWIGFLSLEIQPNSLFVHTLQLTPPAQGKIFGYRVYEWILVKAVAAERRQIACRAFKDSAVVALYGRLGFEIVKTEGILCEMRLNTTQRERH